MNKLARIRKHQLGISLVEILIVMMIAAMVAGVVVMSVPPERSQALEEGERFAARLSMAAELAVTRSELIGLKVGPERYDFYRYERGEWKAYDGEFKSSGAFPSTLAVDVRLGDTSKKNERSETIKDTDKSPRPGILFAPTGETTPFDLSFQQNKTRVDVALDAAGTISVVKHDTAQ